MSISGRRWVSRGALGIAAALAGAAVLGRANRASGGLLVLREWLDHPALFGTLVLALLFVGVLASNWRPWARFAVDGVIGLMLLGAVLLWVFLGPLLTGGDERTIRSEAAPERSDRRLVVEEGYALIDPYWIVSVDEGSGPGTRRWHLAYVNGDWQGMPEVGWDGPDRIRLVKEKETVLIGLGPDGAPDRTVDDGY
ncbi:hypothetical protein ABT093_28030 [Kitasatospora sp. NPDC002551]|uniref:hypothetical protein n=1 Tax=unclassified Kitasatospora TaxID=2633591 RepID=UPI00332DE5BD